MKRIIAITIITLTSQAVVAFAGEPVVSSKQVLVPAPPPPPEFFRPNEFDIGMFGTYVTGVGSGRFAGSIDGWGGGMDFTYWFPWKYAGVRFQGAGVSLGASGGSRTQQVTIVQGFAPVTVKSSGDNNVAAGIVNADLLLRLPLDEFWPGVHLAPYAFLGFGGVLTGGGGDERRVSQTFTVTNSAGESRQVNFTGKNVSSIRNNLASDRVMGHIGGGFEYRFTPHIGLFGEAGYNFVDGSSNNFVQANFGLRYAF